MIWLVGILTAGELLEVIYCCCFFEDFPGEGREEEESNHSSSLGEELLQVPVV